MSAESLQSFRTVVETDASLQALIRDAMRSGQASRVLDIARRCGFDFTLEEAQAGLQAGELSDFELELVSGGNANPKDIAVAPGSTSPFGSANT